MFPKSVLKSFLSAALLLAWPSSALAETLTEQSVVQSVRARHPEIVSARRDADAVAARAEQFSLLPNPSLAWERETLHELERQDIFKLTVPLELSGRRAAGRALVRSEAALTRADAATTESAAVEAVLGLFYEALAAERRVAIAQDALERLEQAGQVLVKRQAEGVTSGYDVHRLEVQVELGRVVLEQSEADLRGLRAALALLLGSDERTLALRGTLAVHEPRPAGGVRRAVSEARQAATEARSAEDAAEKAWIPSVELSGGLRVVELAETHYGYVAGVSLEVPLFSRGQELRAEARTRESAAQARAASLEQRASLEELNARHELAATQAEVERLGTSAAERVQKVLRAAESSYREGNRPLNDLIEAHTIATAIELRRLDAELRAKRAELKLRAARGEFE